DRTASGEGFRRITMSYGPLPASLGGSANVLVATSGEALRTAADSIDIGDTITLGPGEPGFTDLIDLATQWLAEDVYQSGAAQDPSSLTSYDLYAFQSPMTESGGQRDSIW